MYILSFNWHLNLTKVCGNPVQINKSFAHSQYDSKDLRYYISYMYFPYDGQDGTLSSKSNRKNKECKYNL